MNSGIKFIEGVVNAFVVMRDQRIRQDFLVGKETIERTYLGARPCGDLGHCRRLITLLGDDGGTCLQYGGDTQLPLRLCGVLAFGTSLGLDIVEDMLNYRLM